MQLYSVVYLLVSCHHLMPGQRSLPLLTCSCFLLFLKLMKNRVFLWTSVKRAWRGRQPSFLPTAKCSVSPSPHTAAACCRLTSVLPLHVLGTSTLRNLEKAADSNPVKIHQVVSFFVFFLLWFLLSLSLKVGRDPSLHGECCLKLGFHELGHVYFQVPLPPLHLLL